MGSKANKIVIEHHGKPVNEMHPTAAQKQLLTVIYSTVEMVLRSWPSASGKTVVRKMLAQMIIDGDH